MIFSDGQPFADIVVKHVELAGGVVRQVQLAAEEDQVDWQPRPTTVHSHWSRNVEARLSLVQSFRELLRQLSYVIKNQRDPIGGYFAFQSL